MENCAAGMAVGSRMQHRVSSSEDSTPLADVIVVDPHRNRIVWQYGRTDVKGARPGYLDTPDGMDLLPTSRLAEVPAIRALVYGPGRSSMR